MRDIYTYSGYCSTFVFFISQKTREKFVPWRVSPSVLVLRHLNVSWLLLFFFLFPSMIVSIELYSAVHPREKKTYLNVLKVTAWPFVLVPPARVWWSSSFQAFQVHFQTKHRSGWRKWASAMHAKVPNTEIVPVIPTIVPNSTSDIQ